MKSRESFMRKVSICTLNDLNPGFGRPWNKLWIFFCTWHFHNASKEVSFSNFFLNFMHRFKSAILTIFIQFWWFFTVFFNFGQILALQITRVDCWVVQIVEWNKLWSFRSLWDWNPYQSCFEKDMIKVFQIVKGRL